MGEFEELMRLAAQHTRELDKELERKKKKQQLEEERKRKELEKRRQEEKATTAVQLAERRKRDLVLERERVERRREREKELVRKSALEEQTQGREAKASSTRKEKESDHPFGREIPRKKPLTSISFNDLINQASDIPTSSLKLISTSRVEKNASNSRSSPNKRSAGISERIPKNPISTRNPPARDRGSSNENDSVKSKTTDKSRCDDSYKEGRSRAYESDRTRSVSLSRSALVKSTTQRDVRRSASDHDIPSRKAKLSPGLKSTPRPLESSKTRRRSLSPPPKSRKRSFSPRKTSSRKPIDDKEFNEDYVKKGNISSIIGQLFGYDRSRYANERYSDDDMEASITDLRKEESRSAKIARLEDEREEELERQEQERLRARKKARLEMERKKGAR